MLYHATQMLLAVNVPYRWYSIIHCPSLATDISHSYPYSFRASHVSLRPLQLSTMSLSDLGLSCPDRGNFYVCEDAPIQFIGCCTIDPCETDSGICPDDELEVATFDPIAYYITGTQECIDGGLWYTCAYNDPPFMGCCTVNPCAEGECPASSLRAARLSDNEDEAAIFLTPLPSTTQTSASSTSVTINTETLSIEGGASNNDSGDEDDEGLSDGAIAGAAIGGILGAIFIGLFLYWCIRRLKQSRAAHPIYGNGQAQPYQEPKSAPAYAPSSYLPSSPGISSPTSYYDQRYPQMPAQGQAFHAYQPFGYAQTSAVPYHNQMAQTWQPVSQNRPPTQLAASETEERVLSTPASVKVGRESGVSDQTRASEIM